MDLIIKGDLFQHHVANHLPSRSFFTLMQTDKNAKDWYTPLFYQAAINTITNRLKFIFGQHYEQFIITFNQLGACLSGSFILQCLLNKEWDGDIDIYVPTLDNDMKKTGSGNNISPLDLFLLSIHCILIDYEATERYYVDNKRHIEWVRNYSLLKPRTNKNVNQVLANLSYVCGCRLGNYKPDEKLTQMILNENVIEYKDIIFDQFKLQVILVKRKKNQLVDFINHNFDFDICKNIYQNDTLTIHSLNDIITKTTRFKYTWDERLSRQRQEKYIQRGIQFI